MDKYQFLANLCASFLTASMCRARDYRLIFPE
jgi:hypothetical protein